MQKALASLPVGTAIQEHYIVQSLLGQAGFGNVYLVQDQRDQERDWILAEVIKPTEQARYRFALEYISLTPLHQRALPHVQYVFKNDKSSLLYVLMSFIEGSNLEVLRLQQPEKRFPLAQTMAMMSPIIQAVIHLHHQHPPVIHQNIHPANVITLRTTNTPVLAMLHVVKELDSTTTLLRYFAPGYGATEQYAGACSTSTDIYGLGATCYTLLTGIVPPDPLSRSTHLSRGEIDPLKPLNEVIPAIPTFAGEAIQRAMSITAEDRFSTVEQFWGAFESSAQQSLSQISPTMSPTSPPPPAASGQEVVGPTPVPAPGQPPALRTLPRTPRIRKADVVFIVMALLISLGVGVGFSSDAQGLLFTQSATPTPSMMRSTSVSTATPRPTPVSSRYPALAETYTGTLYDVSANVSTSLSLTRIRQNQRNISGYLVLGPKIEGSGPFSGTIDTDKHFRFVVTDATANAKLFFEGVMQSAISMSGDYYRCGSAGSAQGGRCSQASDSYGLWTVTQA